MIIVPIYASGWVRRKCVWCGEKTRERVGHKCLEIVGMPELYEYFMTSAPEHYRCHEEKCSLVQCKDYRAVQRRAAESAARVLAGLTME